MQNIQSSAELRSAIKLLEEEHFISEQALRRQLFVTYTSLKPINILKNTIKEISSPSLMDEMSGTGIGMIGGFLSRKIFVGRSGNAFRNLIGAVLQLGVTTVVSQNSGIIQTAGWSLIQRLIHNHKMKSARRSE